MKNFLILVLAFAIASTELYAQKPLPGFIVTASNDTIDGYIIDRIDARVSLKVEFAKNNDGKEIIFYLPSDLIAFGFQNGRTFKRIGYQEKNGDSTYVFAKAVLHGKLDVHTLRKLNRDQPDIFIFNNNKGQAVRLSPPTQEIIKDENGKRYMANDYRHVQLLNMVKEDIVSSTGRRKKIRYIENDIRNDLDAYNQSFSATFPNTVYQEQREFSYDITGGLPLNIGDDQKSFRIAVYRSKSLPEKTRTVSYIRGISYRYWFSSNDSYKEAANTSVNYRQQFLSIIPIGFNFHKANGFLRPYVYCGLGIAFQVDSNHRVIEYEYMGTDTKIYLYPMINAGAGIKIKIASKFLLAEVTPAIGQGVFFNAGFSF